MKQSKLFPCYSIPLRNFLTFKGIKYELVGLHPETQKMFLVYIKNKKLDIYIYQSDQKMIALLLQIFN